MPSAEGAEHQLEDKILSLFEVQNSLEDLNLAHPELSGQSP